MHKLPELRTAGNKIPNRQAICDTLMEAASRDRSVLALCSDSRGSASMTPFFNAYPKQSVEIGIAEQNLVSISAGLAKCGKKPFAFSPACFLSTRSYEQAKIDCAYSDTNVKLIGISGGVSYGALGMSHHSAQDIAALSAIPNMRVYLPSDPGTQGKRLYYSRGACSLRRPWFYGESDRGCSLPKESYQYDTAGCPGHYRNISGSLRHLWTECRRNTKSSCKLVLKIGNQPVTERLTGWYFFIYRLLLNTNLLYCIIYLII